MQTTTTIAGMATGGVPIPVVTNEVWDVAGRRTELRASVGGVADSKNNYTLDNLNRVTEITQQGQGGNSVANKRVKYYYNSSGEVTGFERHRHLTNFELVMDTIYNRDLAGRVTSSAHRYASEASFAQYVSVYDAASRITQSSRSTGGGSPATETATYNHDNTSQLTGGSRVINNVPTLQSYSYDANGNRTSANGVTVTPTLNNRIYQDGTHQYVYDDEGNIIRKFKIANPAETTYYAYDHRNRLTGVSQFNAAGGLV